MYCNLNFVSSLGCTSLMLLLLIGTPVLPQTKTWYFGENTGVDFSQFPPQGIDGPLSTNEGCAAVTNLNGKVIFSTDGSRIYDGLNNPIQAGLMGDKSSTHSAIIVPHPANPCERFLVFTVGSAESKNLNSGLHVTEIIAAGGNLKVSQPVKLHSMSTEKLAATTDHGKGYWLVSHDYIDTLDPAHPERGKRFYAYHVTPNTSLNNLVPVISVTGTPHSGTSPFGGNYWNSIGQMKFSKEGDKLALALYARATIDLLQFDKSSGRLFQLTRIDQFHQDQPGINIYGVEFSPNGNILYASTGYVNPTTYGRVWGFDIHTNTPNLIWDSKVEVAAWLSSNQNKYPYGALQMGPDNAIYVARNKMPFLDRISNPNDLSAPQYVQQAIALTDTCHLGLPTAIKSVDCSNSAWPCSNFAVDISVDTALCPGDSLKLGFDSVPGFQYRWNTGSRKASIYGQAGMEYRVGVTDTMGCYGTSFFTIPLSLDLTELKIPDDTALCSESRNTLSFAYPGVNYKWEDGSTYEYAPQSSEDVSVEFYSTCDTLQRIIHARVENCSCRMSIPNAFTPDRDNLNDNFELKAPCPLERYILQIYNRWGEKVFESRDINHSWNGRVGNRRGEPGVYVFKLEYEAPLSDPVYRQGSLTLLR